MGMACILHGHFQMLQYLRMNNTSPLFFRHLLQLGAAIPTLMCNLYMGILATTGDFLTQCMYTRLLILHHNTLSPEIIQVEA